MLYEVITLITMETLRQVAMTKDETLSRITSVALVSPDLDVELFRSQVRQIGKLPQPFLIFTSQKDKALRLSARISGVDTRLGNLENADRVITSYSIHYTKLYDVASIGSSRLSQTKPSGKFTSR